MVSPENPLVPRVFVNRVWQWHFGEGIVRSVDDFGTQGAKPTHPELLDYLTVSFEEHNWDLKWLTKEIMMSQVYRQGSAEVPEYLAADPGDKLLWRKAPLRLEAETIRDSMLKVSGLLNERMFGKQEPIKRGPDGQWLEDNQGTRRQPPQPVPGADAHPLGGLPARVRLPGHDVRQPAGAVPLVAADAVAGADEQSAGDAHLQSIHPGSARKEQEQLRRGGEAGVR